MLLSLLSPSCIVASIRELANITLSTTTTAYISNNMAPIQDINMVVDPLDNIFDIDNKFDEVRGHLLALSAHRLRSPSISSSECNEEYHVHVKRESDRTKENKPTTSIGSIQVEYVSQERRNSQVSKAANNTNDMSYQHVTNKNPASSLLSGNNVFNVQLNYDIDQALDPESWDSKFYMILLYDSMEHLVLDIKNIKDSLLRIGKYIKGKSIINSNANSIKDLEGMGKVV